MDMQKNLLYFPEFGAFILGLLPAWWLQWQAADLIWSLWLSSLTLGYLTIFATVAGGAYVGVAVLSHPQFPSDKKGIAIFFGVMAGLFFLGFFSLHFGGFHAGHASFLQNFFPLPQATMSTFSAGFMNPFVLWNAAVDYVLPFYGWFLLPMLIVERHAIFKAFAQCLGLAARIKDSDDFETGDIAKWRKRQRDKTAAGTAKAKSTMNSFLFQPYTNVVKMHCMIFVLAGCQILRLDNFLVYCIISAVYFFPWRVFRKRQMKEC
jgi:hypothetical protein